MKLVSPLVAALSAGCMNDSAAEVTGHDSAPPNIERREVRRDLLGLGFAYHWHVDAIGNPPQKPADLIPFVKDGARLVGRVEDGTYVLHMGVVLFELPDGPTQTVLGHHSSVPDRGGTVLFADGSVLDMTPEEFAKAAKPKKWLGTAAYPRHPHRPRL